MQRTLTIDRDTRDVLRGLVMWVATDFLDCEHAIEEGNGDQVRAFHAKLGLILGLMDDLGWKTTIRETVTSSRSMPTRSSRG